MGACVVAVGGAPTRRAEGVWRTMVPSADAAPAAAPPAHLLHVRRAAGAAAMAMPPLPSRSAAWPPTPTLTLSISMPYTPRPNIHAPLKQGMYTPLPPTLTVNISMSYTATPQRHSKIPTPTPQCTGANAQTHLDVEHFDVVHRHAPLPRMHARAFTNTFLHPTP